MTCVPTSIEWARGAKAKVLCQKALEARLYCSDRVFQYMFTQMLQAYSSRQMSRWVCALAYDQTTPIGVFFGHSCWLGVYVDPNYRNLGVGRSLVLACKPHVSSYISCTDDAQALRFFDAIGVPSA